MKVFIAVGVHPRYKRFIDYLPEGFEYEISGNPDVNKYYSPARTGASLKRFFSLRFVSVMVTKLLCLPRITYYRTGADIIYSTRGVLPLNRKPWVVEVEHPYGFVGMEYKLWKPIQKAITSHFLKSKYCRRIVVVTDSAKKSMEREFKDSEIRKKISVVYTTVEYQKIKKKRHSGVTILMIANNGIYERGLKLIQNIYPELKRKYKVNWIIKTNDSLLKEDIDFMKDYNVHIIKGNFNENQLKDLFAMSDIFVNLSFVDTNSNILYEAMRAGLPIITSDLPPLRDKIRDGYNGFIIPLPSLFWDKKKMIRVETNTDFKTYNPKGISSFLMNRMDRLLKSGKLRYKMGKRNEELIRSGKFSMKRRMSLIKKIISESTTNL